MSVTRCTLLRDGLGTAERPRDRLDQHLVEQRQLLRIGQARLDPVEEFAAALAGGDRRRREEFGQARVVEREMPVLTDAEQAELRVRGG